MGVLYYNSPEEQKKLKTEIHDKKLEMFHTDHVNEKGEPTDGKSGRLIFGTSEQRKNTINVKFTKISGVFDEKLERIVRLNKVFPEMYDSHKKEKVRRLREVIGIDEETQKKLVQELKKMGRIKEDFDDLQELRMIYFQFFQPPYTDKKIEELVKKFRIKSMADRIVVDDIFDEMYLRREPIFVREMSLVYLVTSFKEYVKNISELIFKLNPHLFKSAKTSFSKKSQKTQLEEKMVLEEILNEITEKGPDKILSEIKNHFDVSLYEEDNEEFVEVFLRRNFLIHNGGIPNEKYNKRFPKFADKKLNEISDEYFHNVLKLFPKYYKKFRNTTWKKYGEPAFLKEMSQYDP